LPVTDLTPPHTHTSLPLTHAQLNIPKVEDGNNFGVSIQVRLSPDASASSQHGACYQTRAHELTWPHVHVTRALDKGTGQGPSSADKGPAVPTRAQLCRQGPSCADKGPAKGPTVPTRAQLCRQGPSCADKGPAVPTRAQLCHAKACAPGRAKRGVGLVSFNSIYEQCVYFVCACVCVGGERQRPGKSRGHELFAP
jgi:hypothetical protein